MGRCLQGEDPTLSTHFWAQSGETLILVLSVQCLRCVCSPLGTRAVVPGGVSRRRGVGSWCSWGAKNGISARNSGPTAQALCDAGAPAQSGGRMFLSLRPVISCSGLPGKCLWRGGGRGRDAYVGGANVSLWATKEFRPHLATLEPRYEVWESLPVGTSNVPQ